MKDLKVHLKRIINAPQEKVFNAWLDADQLTRFMTPLPGMPEPVTEADGKQGGQFKILMKVGDREIPHTGEYLEVTPFSKIVFSWNSPFSTDGSTVSIVLTALDDQRTEIDFTHLKFKGDEERNDHENGWQHILEILDKLLSNNTLERAS